MSEIFFTSDHHFGHRNIIKFSNRPFASVEEMDAALIKRWNDKVGPDDEVYHLGDVGLTSNTNLATILEQLNGKIYLIKGNHESAAMHCSNRFEWIKEYFELTVKDAEAHKGEQFIVLFHYAIKEWNASHHGTWHLYGHHHGSLADDPSSRSFDIGVDCHDFYPLSYEEVKSIIQKKNWKPPYEKRI